MRLLEGAEAATSFSTGMAAISNTLFTLLAPGDRVVSVKDTYGGTNKLFTEFLPRLNVQVTLCNTTDHDAIEAEVAKGCTVLYLETPTNPTLKVLDLARLAQAGHAAGAIVVVDNTFATPINTNPLALGADLVLHSATKFLGGHADALGGIVCGSKALVERIYHYREITGATLDPMAAYLLLRGMKTLHLRMRQQNDSALQDRAVLAEPSVGRERVLSRLGDRTRGTTSPSSRCAASAACSASRSRATISTRVRAFLPRLQAGAPRRQPRRGRDGRRTPATTSHVECTREEREAMGIPETLIRYSVGIEDTDDLIADLTQALDGVMESSMNRRHCYLILASPRLQGGERPIRFM